MNGVNIGRVLSALGRGGRHNITADCEYLHDRVVMVTGAGGSIGSELCWQISHQNPYLLVMVDRDESALHALQLALTGRALLDDPRDGIVLADVRDRLRMCEVMHQYRPHVVIHAAALKHQPLLERYPREAVETNVWGTANVAAMAADIGTDVFINISTDKAATPSCTLGATKRIAEQLVSAHASSQYEQTAAGGRRRWLSVRFGNVLGSRGSVLDSFAAQLTGGQAVTVTHPDVDRYVMTVREAVTLALHAGSIGSNGDALVLDMGTPVRIVDLARAVADVLGIEPAIEFTGLRPGEQLHERRLGDGELDNRPHHHLITHVPVPPTSPHHLARLHHVHGAELVATLADLCRRPL